MSAAGLMLKNALSAKPKRLNMTLKRELKKLKRQIKKLRRQVGELSNEQTEIGAIGFYADDEIYDNEQQEAKQLKKAKKESR